MPGTLVEYIPSVPRWASAQYVKSDYADTLSTMSKIPKHHDPSVNWGQDSSETSGRLVFDGNDFSSGFPDALWVIAVPLNYAAGTAPVFTKESLVAWQARFDAAKSMNLIYPIAATE